MATPACPRIRAPGCDRLVGEAKQLTSALQAEIVPAQVTIAGEKRCTCADPALAHRSLPEWGEAKVFTAFDLEAATLAPELACVTARYAALAPFGKVAKLLSELLSVSGAPNAGTVRNRSMRVGEGVVQPNVTTTAKPATPRPAELVVGLDGGYVRGRHWEEERHFEAIAGKVIGAQGS